MKQSCEFGNPLQPCIINATYKIDSSFGFKKYLCKHHKDLVVNALSNVNIPIEIEALHIQIVFKPVIK